MTPDEHDKYLTVDEITAHLERAVPSDSLSVIGSSENGEEIVCATLGSGEKQAVIYGHPHANEPVGPITCNLLINYLQENPEFLDIYTWHIVPCPDPDGVRLAQTWYDQPSLNSYTKGFFRRQVDKQVDWSFPVKLGDYEFKDVPAHTQSLCDLMSEHKPSFVVPLHNCDLGGAYFYMTDDLGSNHREMIKTAYESIGVTVLKYNPEAFYQETASFEPGFIGGFSIKNIPHPQDGQNGFDFAQEMNSKAWGINPEVPLFACDLSTQPPRTTREEAIPITSLVAECDPDDPLIGMLMKSSDRGYLPTDPSLDPVEFWMRYELKTRYLGSLHRALINSGKDSIAHEVDELLNTRIAFVERHLSPVTMKPSVLAGAQLQAILASAHALNVG